MNPNTPRKVLYGAAMITAFCARLGGYFGLAGFLAGGLLALPFAFVLVLLAIALAILILVGIRALLVLLIGETLTTLLIRPIRCRLPTTMATRLRRTTRTTVPGPATVASTAALPISMAAVTAGITGMAVVATGMAAGMGADAVAATVAGADDHASP